MNRSMWVRADALGGLAIVVIVCWCLGTRPFLDGLRAVDLRSIALAAVITCVTTAACAWRWRVVAFGLGVDLSLPRAIAAYYRSQFLNTVLPGGILGDVHRGVDHGRAAGDLSRGLRAVVWERVAGQIVQVAIVVVVLAVVPSPVRSILPFVLAAAGVVAVLVALVVAGGVKFVPRIGLSRIGLSRSGLSRTARAWRVTASDVRQGLLAQRAWPAITSASFVALVGHVCVFLIAAHAVKAHMSVHVLVPLALLVLTCAALPTNIGGWGPREGVAAWAFANAHLGADLGVATATAFGVLMAMATLPGAIVVVAGMRHSGAASGAASRRDQMALVCPPSESHLARDN